MSDSEVGYSTIWNSPQGQTTFWSHLLLRQVKFFSKWPEIAREVRFYCSRIAKYEYEFVKTAAPGHKQEMNRLPFSPLAPMQRTLHHCRWWCHCLTNSASHCCTQPLRHFHRAASVVQTPPSLHSWHYNSPGLVTDASYSCPKHLTVSLEPDFPKQWER